MRRRADECGVAEVRWIDLGHGDGSHTGIASGKIHVQCLCAAAHRDAKDVSTHADSVTLTSHIARPRVSPTSSTHAIQSFACLHALTCGTVLTSKQVSVTHEHPDLLSTSLA